MTGAELLSLDNLHAFYGRVEAVRGISLSVREGEIVALLGPNGAGKTTTMKAICRGVSTEGRISFDGRDISRMRKAKALRVGIGHVPEGRGTFIDLTVSENLRLAMVARRRSSRDSAKSDLTLMYEIFPKLYDLRARAAGKLSGGEQQMLAIARAMLTRPRLLLVDEPSTGLAPNVVQEMYEKLAELFRNWKTTVLLAEQDVTHALGLASRAYVIANGTVRLSGDSGQIASSPDVLASYLGEAVLLRSEHR